VKILEYADLVTSKVTRQYQKLIGYLEEDDFHSAEVKKFAEHDLYRAKLDESNRLLFRIMTYKGVRYALILEVVLNHAYDKSKFLRGTRVDEAKIPLLEKTQIEREGTPSLIYINPSNTRFHILDKIISFDPEQQEIYRHALPLIVIGPAGSGKTALTLEKMKRAHGQVLYVTLSPYLADNSRNIYYAHHYENEDQEISFLSFREYLETMRVPEGREITYRVFASWLMRFPRQQRVADAHRLYEEFRGVITGSIVDKPYLSREDYLSLGIRQSIYLDEERDLVYTLFEKYLGFLKENSYYDPNILTHGYLKHVRQIYDFIVVDEVQDITNIQLQLILGSLKNPDNFILCGDSNQIVHPNFFSWSTLKTMLYHAAALESQKVMRILQSNFRNSAAVTGLSNKLLRIKQKRFGSIDRESTYLMNSLSENGGDILFIKDTDKVKRELNQKIRRSTKFAVLVMRDEEKAAVRQFFDTPLLFSIQEAKGLEYENVILLNFISGERASFQEIIRGVNPEDLEGELEYMRARDKSDKSLEAYKFFVNSLYVAITRAVQRIYLIESDHGHPLLRMLGLLNARDQIPVEVKQSSREEWQAEARKLELQGRQDQADEIRRDILKTQSVPWDLYTPERVMALIDSARDKEQISQKPKKALFEYALFYDEPRLIELLSVCGFDKAKQIFFLKEGKRFFNWPLYNQQRANFTIHYMQRYTGTFFKEILRQCELYGINHRTVFNKTSLMLAAASGNTALIRELLAAGADTELTDNYGLTAWQGALRRAVQDKKYASELFPRVSELLAPSSVSLKADDRLIKIDSSQGEFLLFHIFIATLHHRINYQKYDQVPLTAVILEGIAASLPDNVIQDYRRKRAYISALLSKNEIDSTNPYCKKLFRRKRTGHYILNPKLAIRLKEEWIDIYRHANTDLMSGIGSESGPSFQFIIQSLFSDSDDDPYF
jgi:hypothetical protein